MKSKGLEFGSLEELALILEDLGLQLHAKNRIGGEESNFVWHIAETIRNVGRLAAQSDEDPSLLACFGSGCEAGSIPDREQPDRFLALLREEAISQQRNSGYV